MNEKLDLVKILNDAPKGTKLWSPVCGECEFLEINGDNPYPIKCKPLDGDGYWRFIGDGRFSFSEGAECVLFPSKGNRDWETFKVPNTHKHFEPFQKVLCATDNDYGYEVWAADFYSHYDDSTREHYLASGYVVDDGEIVPFEGNEDKLGKLVR